MTVASRPDPDRLAVWRQFLTAHSVIVGALAHELEADPRGMPLTWYDVCVQLSEAGGRLRMSELAGRALLDKSSLTRVVDRMCAAGLVVREPDPEDGRGVVAVLTPEGRARFRAAAAVHLRGVQRRFARHLTDTDVAALARAFGKLVADDA